MQLICYLSLYKIPISINAEAYNNEFKKILEFDLLNPEGIVGIFVPGWKLQDLFLTEVETEDSFSKKASVLNDLKMFIVIGIVALLVFAILALITLNPKHK